jgi:hypothetical protein
MSMTETQLKYMQDSARLYQRHYDDHLKQIGFRAPQPVVGQAPDDYRRETMRTLKKQFLSHHPLNRINMRGLPADVLPQFEAQVLQAAVGEANNPLTVPPGEMRRIDKLDDTGVLREIHWVRQESFVKDQAYGYRPGRRVVSFAQPADNRGRALNQFGHAGPPGRLVLHNGLPVGTTGRGGL